MQFLNDIDTVISIICGIGSIVMFLLAKRQKDKCKEIYNSIQQIQIQTKESTITSRDKFKIRHVGTFDNKKTIQ